MKATYSQQLLCDIQNIRNKRQLTYRQLAKESFVSYVTLWQLCSGRVSKISLQNLDRLSNYRKKWENYIETTY
jgi:transcriptional regulator with XRE-family HTH domain